MSMSSFRQGRTESKSFLKLAVADRRTDLRGNVNWQLAMSMASGRFATFVVANPALCRQSEFLFRGLRLVWRIG
jgi:hypothetical protein